MRPFSINQKLTLIIMTASTVALLVISTGFVGYELISFKETMRQDLLTQARMIAHLSTASLEFGEGKDAQEILQVLSNRKHIRAAAIYQGTRLFAWYPTNAAPANFPAQPRADGFNEFDFRSDKLTVFQEVRLSGETIGAVCLQSDLKEVYNRLGRYLAMFALLMLATSAITYFLSRRLQKFISQPIFDLAQTAKAVSQQKNYGMRARKHANDELGDLIDGFNEMLSEIQQRDAEVQEAKTELELRVQERTHDLEMEITERRRAQDALHEQFSRTTLLNQITQAVSERQDLESILYVVLRQLEDHLAIDLGVVCLFDGAAETLNVAALRLKNPLLQSRLDLHEGIVTPLADTGLRSCKHGETVYVPDTHKSPAPLHEKFARAGLRAVAAVPLMVEGKLFGTLLVARLAVDSFSGSDCEFLRTLSEHVALAGHQARLHEELARAYNELRQTQNTVMQQERLKALGQMASGIAHDINNALSPVVGFADLLSKAETTLSLNGKKYLQYIKTAGEDIAHIVARLREFYRRRDEHEELLSLSLNAVAMQVIDMTRPRWRDIPQGRGVMVEMRTDFDANLPALVGIESEVREALTNLILNAADAIPNGGTITVRTRVGAHLAGSGPTHVILEVSDTGIGMDEETRKHCLEPFFSTKGQRGTGLGLAMVYGVMERHEGEIEIDSKPGRGTVMKLIFPLRRLSSRGTVEGQPEEVVMPLHVLCIDDEPLLRELLREVLERDGHKVQLSDSGQRGVDMFRFAAAQGVPFDLVITDLGMPYFDGRQVAKVIKRESPATPVIMLTGWGTFMKEDGEVLPQVDGILSKPPRSTELRAMLQRVARSKREDQRRAGDASAEAKIVDIRDSITRAS